MQWGAALDETLGEEVRVTIIATGYEMDGLPKLDEDGNEDAIEDAIKQNYPEDNGDNTKEPPVTIDLSDTIRSIDTADAPKTSAGTKNPADTKDADEVVIVTDEDSTPTGTETAGHRGRWRLF